MARAKKLSGLAVNVSDEAEAVAVGVALPPPVTAGVVYAEMVERGEVAICICGHPQSEHELAGQGLARHEVCMNFGCRCGQGKGNTPSATQAALNTPKRAKKK